MALQRRGGADALLQQRRSLHAHLHALAQLVLHHHLRQQRQPAAVARHQAQHRHVVDFAMQPRPDARLLAQGVELAAQRMARAGLRQLQAVEFVGRA